LKNTTSPYLIQRAGLVILGTVVSVAVWSLRDFSYCWILI